MPPKKSKAVTIDPDLLPESITKVGPHEPLITFFTEEKSSKALFEHWADFYEKKPAIAIRELISVIPFIATGREVEIKEKDVQKNRWEDIKTNIHDILQEIQIETPIDEYFKGTSTKAFDFWTKLCNELIVPKGLFLDEFDIFKDWAFEFCEANDRTLRSAAIIAICSILEFLADSIKRSTEALDNLQNSTKSDKSAVTKRQIETFQTELDNSRTLSMQLYTTVIKPRSRDYDPKLREACTITMGKIIQLAPDDFGDMNIIKVLINALNDESSKNRKQAIKQIESLISPKSDLKEFAPFFKQISPILVKICDDVDNSLSIAAFKLMNKMLKKKLFHCKTGEVECIFKLTGDDSLNVRTQAAQFFTNFLFKGKLVKDLKQSGNDESQVQALNEAQLTEFARLSSEFSEAQLINSISVFSTMLDCFSNWDLICEIIISSDDSNQQQEFVKILSISAEAHSKNGTDDQIDRLTHSMLSYLSKSKNQGLLQLFDNDETSLSYLTYILQYLDITVISGVSQEKLFSSLLDTLHHIFIKSTNRNVYMNLINGISQWSKQTTKKSKSKLAQLAQKEISNIAKEFSSLTNENLEKFQAILTFHDFSQNEKIRDFLKEVSDLDSNTESEVHAAAVAIKCLETMYIWDVRRVKDKEDEKEEYFVEFDSLTRIFVRNLHSQHLEVKTAAFDAFGSLLSLARFVVADADIDTDSFETFVETFHELGENQQASFKSLTRPIINRIIPYKYAIHSFWYLQDNGLKPYVKDFMKTIDDEEYPIDGSELGSLFDFMIQNNFDGDLVQFVQPPQVTKSKAFIKAIANKITARESILSCLNTLGRCDELIPVLAPILENMSYADAEFVRPSADGQMLEIINKVIKGKKLKPKDFAVTIKKPKKVESEDNYDDEDDDAEDEGAGNESDESE